MRKRDSDAVGVLKVARRMPFPCRAVAYGILASLVWIVLAISLKSVDCATVLTLASICVLGGLACFPLLAYARHKRWGALSEYLLGIVGRTGCPLCVALYCVVVMEPNAARALVYRLLAWYFVTAPCLLVALAVDEGSGLNARDEVHTKTEPR